MDRSTWSRRNVVLICAIATLSAAVITATIIAVSRDQVDRGAATGVKSDPKINGLLLDTNAVSSMVGGSQLVLVLREASLAPPAFTGTAPDVCEYLSNAGDARQFADSDWITARRQVFGEKESHNGQFNAQWVYEYVVQMPSSGSAQKLVNETADRWRSCQQKVYTAPVGGSWLLQNVVDDGGVIIATSKSTDSDRVCQRVMGAAAEYTVGVQGCGPGADQAHRIARQIIAKVK